MLTDIKYITEIPKLVPIAPAQERNCTLPKKYDYKNSAYCGTQSVSIARRNARERSRVKQVNDGFNALRKRLPPTVVETLSGNPRRGSGKKLSKVDTLRMVVEYIKHLQRIVEESDQVTYKMESMARVAIDKPYEIDINNFERNSPYLESLPSPTSSEYSSGVSSIYLQNTPQDRFEETNHFTEADYILNSLCW